MPTRILLLQAAPTQWDLEDRLVGGHPLPITGEGLDEIRRAVDSLPFPIQSVYRAKTNEGCDQVAHILALKFRLRPRNNSNLDGFNLGLWEGLTTQELKFRFPTVFSQWLESPLSITPPDGENLSAAIGRLGSAVKTIARRNAGLAIGIVLRPMSLQIAFGVLSGESPVTIGGHLHHQQPTATIELPG